MKQGNKVALTFILTATVLLLFFFIFCVKFTPYEVWRWNRLHKESNKLFQNQRYEDAAQLSKKALKFFGPDHVTTSLSLNLLGNISGSQMKYEESLAYHSQALAIQEKILNSHDPLLATTLNYLALDYYYLKRFTQAERLLTKSIQILKSNPQSDPWHMGKVMADLAMVQVSQKKLNEAKKNYEPSIQILETNLGSDHPDVLQVREELNKIKTPLRE